MNAPDQPASSPVLEVRNLSVDIAVANGTVHAVRNVSFSVERGQTLCIVGESGCGKSITSLALMDLLPGAAKRSADSISIAGRDLTRASRSEFNAQRGQRMAMIFQEPVTALNPSLTIGVQMCESYRHHRKASATQARQRAVELLGRVGIASAEQRLGQYPHQLSGGLRQRVMIAMALMCEPDVLIADEPTTALDVTIQAQILRLLIELQRDFGIAIVLVTHDLGIVAQIAHHVAVMYAGQVVETGNCEQIFNQPRHPYTRGLLRCIPVPGRIAPGGHLGIIPGTVPALTGALQGCTFRERCEHVQPPCQEVPPLRLDTDGHAWRCVLDKQGEVA